MRLVLLPMLLALALLFRRLPCVARVAVTRVAVARVAVARVAVAKHVLARLVLARLVLAHVAVVAVGAHFEKSAGGVWPRVDGSRGAGSSGATLGPALGASARRRAEQVRTRSRLSALPPFSSDRSAGGAC